MQNIQTLDILINIILEKFKSSVKAKKLKFMIAQDVGSQKLIMSIIAESVIGVVIK